MRIINYLLVVFVCFASANANAKRDCETDNKELRAMPEIGITLTRSDGSTHSMRAKMASNNATRAAGFQRVCESTIESMPILFVFDRESIPSFHMNNVVAPIDIAFIDKTGQLESIQSMRPYSFCLLYTSPSPRDKRQSRMPSSA